MLRMRGWNIERGDIRIRRGWAGSRRHYLRGELERGGRGCYPLTRSNIVPDDDNVEGKSERNYGIAQPQAV